MTGDDNLYNTLGVSSKKEDVHKALKSVNKGLFPGAFCRIIEDINDRKGYCSIFHADGAGTKASLAYMYYKETGDISVFKGIVRDAMVMNLDDILCVGAIGNIYFSNNLGRNRHYVDSSVIGTIIKEYYEYSEKLTSLGLNVKMCGGETADIGDIVKTLVVDATAFTTMKREDVIDASNIKNNDVIIGLVSYGKASYEDEYNSGIGSNGLTLARHGLLSHEYYKKYPECYDQNLDEKYVFFGNFKLTDSISEIDLSIGKALLSPTRTYAPIIKEVVTNYRNDVHGIIHNTGGGQTKILNFGKGIKYIKNNLFKIPKIFELIQRSSETQWREMYNVFNMGHRMEILCNESIAPEIIKIARKYEVDSKIIGFCEKSPLKSKNVIEIKSEFGSFTYE
ncbi:MAG: phosphoribosylformylglycinamidine cyclo-ligase [Candidatus Lokiarchaeia archaeon]|nr:phosphoribosylformylglycinamidine cyclo-ligase [Candidatus Lokiarchaeia archaeon]